MKISDHDESREGLDISATCHDFAISGSSFTANCTNELGALIANDINTGMSICLYAVSSYLPGEYMLMVLIFRFLHLQRQRISHVQ
jgi:hypothetical protein